MSSIQPKLVFVYGTLKTGEPNYYLMTEGGLDTCKPKGKYKSVERFPLVVASRYNIPYMLYAKGTGHQVEGELYEVSEDQLSRMDKLECHPDYYERMDILLTPVQDGNGATETLTPVQDGNGATETLTPVQDGNGATETITAEAYFLVKFRQELLHLSMFNSYTDLIDGKKYVRPAERKSSSPYWHEVHTGYTDENI